MPQTIAFDSTIAAFAIAAGIEAWCQVFARGDCMYKGKVGLNNTAQGAALQVVVDSEATGKALISNGQLRNRVTIIPLNKVRAHLLHKKGD